MTDLPVAKWFRSTSLTPGTPRLTAITDAAQSFAAVADAGDIIALVDTAFLGAGNSTQERFAALVRETDPTYAPEADDRQARIAACLCLAQIIHDERDTAQLASHAILSASWLQLHSPVGELPARAQAGLDGISALYRDRRAPGSATAKKQLDERPNLSTSSDDLSDTDANAIVDYIESAVTAAVQSTNVVLASLHQQLRANDEEIDILWWGFAGFSSIMNQKVSSITSPGAAAIAIGIELAQLVQFPVEPDSTGELMQGLLGTKSSKSVSIQTAVEATIKGDLHLPVGLANQRYLPILTSLSEAQALDGNKAWQDSVKRWSIDTSLTHPTSSIARQTLREVLMVKALTT